TATISNPRSMRLRRFEPFPDTQTPILTGRSSLEDHALRPSLLDHLPDDEHSRADVPGRDDEDHAHAHVEGAEHLVVGDAAAALYLAEDRRHVPRAPVQDGAEAPWHHAGQVAGNATSGDMGGGLP